MPPSPTSRHQTKPSIVMQISKTTTPFLFNYTLRAIPIENARKMANAAIARKPEISRVSFLSKKALKSRWRKLTDTSNWRGSILNVHRIYDEMMAWPEKVNFGVNFISALWKNRDHDNACLHAYTHLAHNSTSSFIEFSTSKLQTAISTHEYTI